MQADKNLEVAKTKSTKSNSNKITSPNKVSSIPSKTLDDYFSKLSGAGRSVNDKTAKLLDVDKPSLILVNCPICQKEFTENEINPHLDLCASS